MRVLKRNPWLYGLAVFLTVLVVYGEHARADVTTDQPGSVIIFPKVISNGTRDTYVEITNTSNMPASAHCFYVNAIGHCSVTTSQVCNLDSDCPSAPSQESCIHECQEIDFDISLTAQQPTVWEVSQGRDPGQPGYYPGNPPAQGPNFEGELKCIQTDPNGAPFAGNALTGRAVLYNENDPTFSAYDGITIQAMDASAGVMLDNTHYNACPAAVEFSHLADGVNDPNGNTVQTELTLVPCTEDFENQAQTGGAPVSATAIVTNELEQPLSATITFNCWYNRLLADIPNDQGGNPFTGGSPFDFSTLNTPFAKTRITPTTGDICYSGPNEGLPCTTDAECQPIAGLGCRPAPGLVGVAEEFHYGFFPGSDAFNLHLEGSRPGDVIIIP